MRKQFVKTVSEVLRADSRTVLLLGDISVYNFRDCFYDFSDRVFNVGILEQATVSLAAGLAAEGMIPIVHTIAPFMIERAMEQLKLDFGYQRLGGNFISVGGSYDYSQLGCSHHCPADVSTIRHIPRSRIIVPGHPDEFDAAFKALYSDNRLNYFRLSERSNTKANPVDIKKGSKALVLAVGPMLDRTVEACRDLDVTILYDVIIEEYGFENIDTPVIIVEPFYQGSLSSIFNGSRVLSIGVPRQFLRNYGTVEEHDEACGLTAPRIRERIRSFLNI